MPEPKSAKAGTAYAVYQQEAGSLTLGEHRLTPLTVSPVPAEVEAVACSSLPVVFFSTAEAAQKNVDKLRAEFASKRKPA